MGTDVEFMEPFEILSREFRMAQDAKVMKVNVTLYWSQDFHRFQGLVRDLLRWELKLDQKIRYHADGARFVYMCTAVKL